MKKHLTILVCGLLWAVGGLKAQADITVTSQTQSKTVKVGATNVSFSVAATPGTGTLAYQWYLRGTGQIANATNSSYTIPGAVATSDMGFYDVVLTDDDGSITNTAGILIVATTPQISTQPAGTNTGLNGSVTLTVSASGNALSYIWKNGATVQSSTSNSCVVDTSAAGSNGYTVVVTNLAGAVTSSVASVVVYARPSIKTDLSNKTVGTGSNVTFFVVATNIGGSYAWFFNASNALSGTATNYAITGVHKSDAGNYTVVLSNLAGKTTSAVAVLTVLDPPHITNQPTATNIVAKGADVTLTVQASGDSLSYQWSSNSKAISGATNASLALTSLPVMSTAKYTVKVSNLVGTETSRISYLTVFGPPVISPLIKDQKVTIGQALSLTVKATGVAPYTNLAYIWMTNGAADTNVTTSSYQISHFASNNAGAYAVIVTNFGGRTTNSFTITAQADTKAPTLKITSPGKSITNTTWAITGTATDDVSVTNVTYSLDGGSTYTNALTTNNWAKWYATNTFALGSNTLIVIARDYNGNIASNNLKVFCAPWYTATYTNRGSGIGSITGWKSNVQYATSYKVTAKPSVQNYFLNWTAISGIKTNTDTNALAFTFTVTNNVNLGVTFETNRFCADAGTYYGLLAPTNGITHLSSGFLQATLDSNLTYSAKVSMGGTNFTLSGRAATNGSISTTLANGSSVALRIDHADLQLTGTVSSVTWTSAVTADLSVFTKKYQPTNYVGNYTLAIPPATNGLATNGYGYGSVKVGTDGKITFAGYLADGTAISQSVPLSQDGMWPLYVPLYPTAGKTNTVGELMGWIQISPRSSNSAPDGTVFWIKPASTNAIYGAGLTNQVDVLSSILTNAVRPLSMTSGTASFSGGSLSNALSDEIFINSGGLVTSYDSDYKFKIANTGVLTGTFKDPGTSKSVSFSGVVLPNQTNAVGFFLGTSKAGTVRIIPSN